MREPEEEYKYSNKENILEIIFHRYVISFIIGFVFGLFLGILFGIYWRPG